MNKTNKLGFPCDIEGHDVSVIHMSVPHRTNGRRYKKVYCYECFKKSQRDRAKERHAERRRKALAAYGGKCSCCGVDDDVFLTIDHIDGKGSEHRDGITNGRGRRAGSTPVYRWLEQNGYPKGFRVLCFNCNYAEFHGGCPHKTKTAKRKGKIKT